jgi:hypothetical protein
MMGGAAPIVVPAADPVTSASKVFPLDTCLVRTIQLWRESKGASGGSVRTKITVTLGTGVADMNATSGDLRLTSGKSLEIYARGHIHGTRHAGEATMRPINVSL